MINDLHASDVVKAASGGILLGVWVGIRVAHVTGAEDVTNLCQTLLTALGAHYLTAWKQRARPRQATRSATPAAAADRDPPKSDD